MTGALSDFTVAPIKSSVLAVGYFVSTAAVTLIVCYVALFAGLVYIAATGAWTLTAGNVLLAVLDVFLVSLFGTAFSSAVCCLLRSQGGATAISVIVSSVYGFLCGAYYPISQFSDGIKSVIICLPGTYGTMLFRNHLITDVMDTLAADYFPEPVVTGIKASFDINVDFFGTIISKGAMYGVIIGAIAVLTGIFILLNALLVRNKIKIKFKHEQRDK